MRKLNKSILLLFVFFLFFTIHNNLFSQIENEILVYIKPAYINFPDSTSAAKTISQSQINSTALSNLLAAYEVLNIKRTFPEFYKNDSIIVVDSYSINVSHFSRIYTLLVYDKNIIDTLLSLLNDMPDEIVYAEKNYNSIVMGCDDEYYKQWYLKNSGQVGGTSGADIKIEDAWKITHGGTGYKIALLDHPVQIDHQDLDGRITKFLYNGGYPTGITANHGNMMAGIIGANVENDCNIKGINWTTPIISYSISTATGGQIGDNERSYKIRKAAEDCVVLSNSWSSNDPSSNIPIYNTSDRLAFQYVTALGKNIVACMQNFGGSQGLQKEFPASFNGVISVGAVDWNNDRPSYSNYGDWIELVAPGGAHGEDQTADRILSLGLNNTTTYDHGTSQATAMVSGVIGLMQNLKYHNRTQVQAILELSADDLYTTGWDQYTGYGRLNSAKALSYSKFPYEIHNAPSQLGGTVVNTIHLGKTVITGASNYFPDGTYYPVFQQVVASQTFSVPNRHTFIGGWAVEGENGGWALEINDSPNYHKYTPTPFCGVVRSGTSVSMYTYVVKLYARDVRIYTSEPLIGTFPRSAAYVEFTPQFLTKNNNIKLYDATVVHDNQQIIIEPGVSEVSPTINEISVSDVYVNDSSQVILQDSAILQLPDNYTLHIAGKTSSLILNPHSKIKFGENSKIVIDSNATFIANGATFEALDTAKKWKGIVLKNSDTVNINNCTFKNVKVDSSYNHGYALVVYNSKNTNIDSCQINNSAGGVLLYFQSNTFYYPNVNISNNEIKTSSLIYNGINVAAYSSNMSSLNIENNIVQNTASPGGGSGIFTYGILTSPVKYNTVTNFEKGIDAWYSSLDIFKNNIATIAGYNSRGVFGVGSTLNMAPTDLEESNSWLGGANTISTEEGYCIQTDASTFNLKDGYNILNINNSTYGYHVRGYFPTTSTDTTNAQRNCFQVGNIPVVDTSYIKEYMIWANTSRMMINFSDMTCGINPLASCSFYVIQGGFTIDTLWGDCEEPGGGGHMETSLQNMMASAPQDVSFRELYNGMNINMRKKEYEFAEAKCKAMLEQYPGNAKTNEAVSKLYFASLIQDNNGDKIGALKSYYESYILNHSEYTEIIQGMFYFIQKCKASLGQYTSALQGFQTIINEFPTSYNGLVARWDYMATQLLDTSSGQGGGHMENETATEILTCEQEHERLISFVEDPTDKYDKTKFTKNDRKIIASNIVTAFEDQKTKEAKKLTELEAKVTKSDATEGEWSQYQTMKKLKDIVKIKNVKNINEHISTVQLDIRQINVAGNYKGKNEKNNNILPYDYKLNQNYPNPFNPSTKINFELKYTGFVSLKIYDLLGREIAELVNETKDAGRYSIDFNASKYMMASGIYFYRIKASEFVDTKRMVLVK
jgi:tetratricopeptide (TPR) repeat protein